jgi:hypothetical protein
LRKPTFRPHPVPRARTGVEKEFQNRAFRLGYHADGFGIKNFDSWLTRPQAIDNTSAEALIREEGTVTFVSKRAAGEQPPGALAFCR